MQLPNIIIPLSLRTHSARVESTSTRESVHYAPSPRSLALRLLLSLSLYLRDMLPYERSHASAAQRAKRELYLIYFRIFGQIERRASFQLQPPTLVNDATRSSFWFTRSHSDCLFVANFWPSSCVYTQRVHLFGIVCTYESISQQVHRTHANGSPHYALVVLFTRAEATLGCAFSFVAGGPTAGVDRWFE